MDFGFSPEQEMLRASVRKLLDAECPSTLVRAMLADTTAHAPALWRHLADLGLLGILVPSEDGGQGGTFLDLVVVLEEMGKSSCRVLRDDGAAGSRCAGRLDEQRRAFTGARDRRAPHDVGGRRRIQRHADAEPSGADGAFGRGRLRQDARRGHADRAGTRRRRVGYSPPVAAGPFRTHLAHRRHDAPTARTRHDATSRRARRSCGAIPGTLQAVPHTPPRWPAVEATDRRACSTTSPSRARTSGRSSGVRSAFAVKHKCVDMMVGIGQRARWVLRRVGGHRERRRRRRGRAMAKSYASGHRDPSPAKRSGARWHRLHVGA
jgi:hypothetical protein